MLTIDCQCGEVFHAEGHGRSRIGSCCDSGRPDVMDGPGTVAPDSMERLSGGRSHPFLD
jgi:hypothetical protein